MNIRLVSRILGQIIIGVSLSMVFSLAWAFAFPGEILCAGAFLKAMATGFGIGAMLLWAGKKASGRFFRREGLLTVTLSWFLMSALGALPFYFSGTFPGTFIDCYFEAMSGFTTTGASILERVESIPSCLLYWRSFMQWLGGMGVVVLFVAVFPALGIEAKHLYQVEVPGIDKKGAKPRIKDAASLLWKIYLALTALQVILLMIGGMSFFEASAHTFATMSTGGFSTRTASIAGFDSLYIELVIVVFMVLAGINFSLFAGMLSKQWRSLLVNWELHFYLALLLGCTLLVWWSVMTFNDHTSPIKGFRESLFSVVSLMTTTGFVTADFDRWNVFSQFLLLILMFIGGCSGSTSGSMKVARLVIAYKAALMELKKFFLPRRILTLKINRQAISQDTITMVMGFVFLFLFSFTVASLALMAMGLDPVTSLSASIACLGNVGPGLAKVGPTTHYFHLPAGAKALLCFLMAVGRLEVFPVLLLFWRGFWRN